LLCGIRGAPSAPIIVRILESHALKRQWAAVRSNRKGKLVAAVISIYGLSGCIYFSLTPSRYQKQHECISSAPVFKIDTLREITIYKTTRR
jgi:hypothetical protein